MKHLIPIDPHSNERKANPMAKKPKTTAERIVKQKFWGIHRPGRGLNYFSLSRFKNGQSGRLSPGEQIVRVTTIYSVKSELTRTKGK